MSSPAAPPSLPEGPLVIVFNRRALGARALKRSGMEEALRERGLPFEFVDTTNSDEARAAAQAAAEGGRVVVAAGGDGTALDVVNGVLAAGNPAAAVAVIPLGTGNDLARSLGRVGHGLERALDALVEGHIVPVDVGQVNGAEYYINALGIGFDAEVVRRRLKNRIKLPTYFPDAVRTFLGYEPRLYRVSWEGGEREGAALMLAAMNGVFEGGGVKLAPRASLEDGRLDVYWIDPVPFLKFARYVWAVRRGIHSRLPVVEYRQVDRITVESDTPIQYHIDGEYRQLGEGARLEIEVHHQRLPMIV